MITRRCFLALGGGLAAWAVSGVAGAEENGAAPSVWRVEALKEIGGHATDVIGAPKIGAGAVVFDGEKDGLLVANNPLAGLATWTVEVLFKADETGPAEQRFWHAQDVAGARVLIETRLDGMGSWWLDTYAVKPGQEGRTLIDPKRRHATGKWHWVALRYDGKTLAHFVNGEKEREGEVVLGPMGEGKTSLGVRQNRVHWFKGAMREVRVTPVALAEGKLQRVE